MSQKTLDTLQTLKDEYEQNDIHERDSIGRFVDRQAVKLGLTSSKYCRSGNFYMYQFSVPVGPFQMTLYIL